MITFFLVFALITALTFGVLMVRVCVGQERNIMDAHRQLSTAHEEIGRLKWAAEATAAEVAFYRRAAAEDREAEVAKRKADHEVMMSKMAAPPQAPKVRRFLRPSMHHVHLVEPNYLPAETDDDREPL